ncbi:unnamed protein product, partial [Rotaria socialis]
NPPGFAFILFKYGEDAVSAVRNMDGRMVCGQRVRVEHAKARSVYPRNAPSYGGYHGGDDGNDDDRGDDRKRRRHRSRDRRSRSRSNSRDRSKKKSSRRRHSSRDSGDDSGRDRTSRRKHKYLTNREN